MAEIYSFDSVWETSSIKSPTDSVRGKAASCNCAGPGGNPPILLADEPTASLDAQAGRTSAKFSEIR